MKLKPLYDRVVIARKISEHVSAGGIVMMLEQPVREPEGTVLAVGHDTTLTVGDTVLFKKDAGNEVKVDGQSLLVMREDDVIAVLT